VREALFSCPHHTLPLQARKYLKNHFGCEKDTIKQVFGEEQEYIE
jgi:hypothetical protein